MTLVADAPIEGQEKRRPSSGEVIAVDLDGVLVDFLPAYADLLLTIRPDLEHTRDNFRHPQAWNFEQSFGFTLEDVSEAWRRVREDTHFWWDMGALPQADEALDWLQTLSDEGHYVYFVTHRFGVGAKRQSEWWLRGHGMENPTVVMAQGRKGPLLRALGTTLAIEDRAENWSDIQESGVPRAYLCDRTWNGHVSAGAWRVTSVCDMLLREGLKR